MVISAKEKYKIGIEGLPERGEKMKCPLFTTSSIAQGGVIDYKRWDCLKQECAWWDEERVCCQLRTLAKQVTRLADRKEVPK